MQFLCFWFGTGLLSSELYLHLTKKHGVPVEKAAYVGTLFTGPIVPIAAVIIGLLFKFFNIQPRRK